MPSIGSEDHMKALATTFLGRHLTPAQLLKVAAIATPVRIASGAFLFREGEHNSNVFVLLHGQIDLVMNVRSRGTQRILSLGPGDLVAWSSILGDGTMTCSALCLSDAELIAVDAKSVQERMALDHEFGYHFMQVVARALAARLIATRLQLLDLFKPATVPT